MAAIIMPYGFDQGLFYDEDWNNLSYEEKQKRISRMSMQSPRLSLFPPNELEQVISLEQMVSTLPKGMPPSTPSSSLQRPVSKGKGPAGRLKNHHPILVPPLSIPSSPGGSTRIDPEPVTPVSPLSPSSEFWSPPPASPSTLTSPSQTSLQTEEKETEQQRDRSFEAESRQLYALESMIAGFPIPRREIPIRPLPRRYSSSTGVIPIKFAAIPPLPKRRATVTPASEQRHPGKRGAYISKTTKFFEPSLSTWDEDDHGENAEEEGWFEKILGWVREQVSHVATSNSRQVVRKKETPDWQMTGARAGGRKTGNGKSRESWRYA